ncbi:MAG: multiheme c-type cytochrome [Polyangiaceae bacterium]
MALKSLSSKSAAVSIVLASGVIASVVAACGSSSGTPKTLTKDELMDPQSCGSCHSQHLDEWSQSMHAYASDDPIFVAMNKRGLRETNGELGNFCVQCHAPVAMRTGATVDGSNLAQLPTPMHGVTCYFCHSVDSVYGVHNNTLRISDDSVLRADISDPRDNTAHNSMYSALHDGAQPQSASMCGACHDVTTVTNVDVEKTYAEWQGAIYAKNTPQTLLTCSGCHMPSSQAPASDQPNMPVRAVHSHSTPGIDISLTSAISNQQKVLVQQNLDPALVAKLCVTPPGNGPTLTTTLDDAFVGHNWPSGATHDRRAWLEVIAYQAGNVVFSSGVVADQQDVLTITDPNLWIFRERLLDANGVEVKFMWQAAKTDGTFLTPSVTNDPNAPGYYHALSHTYDVPPNADKITMRLRVISIGYDVIDSLIASGDLAPASRANIPVFTLAGTELTWTTANGFGCIPQ